MKNLADVNVQAGGHRIDVKERHDGVTILLDGEVLYDSDEKAAEGKKQIEALREAGMVMEQWDVDDIEVDLAWCGMAGSPTKVHRVQWIVLTKEGHTEVEPTEEGVRGMVRELVVDRTLG